LSEKKLNIEVEGSGPPVVLIHGWGMHAGIFRPIVEQLKDRFTFYLIDLPGHGDSTVTADLSELDSLTELITKEIQQLTNRKISSKISLLGWSLGGLIAQRMAALYPEFVRKLILVSSSACFANKHDWNDGIDAAILEQFSAELGNNYQQTLDRFLAVQFMGSAKPKEHLKLARKLIAMKTTPKTSALQQGLDLLKKTDLRAGLSAIKCPCLLLSGDRDTLIPTRAIRFIGSQIPQARCYLFKGASHAPFLTHSVAFNHNLEQFLL